jgi:hypothetical protein
MSMKLYTVYAIMALSMTSCRGGQWVYQEQAFERSCPGGKINQEKRTTEMLVGGRTRNTITRTDACLD